MKEVKERLAYSVERMADTWFVCIAMLIFSNVCCVQAGDVTFEATVDKNVVSLGEHIQLSLTFHGTANAQAPQLPDIDNFTGNYLGPSTRMSIINGKVSTSIAHIYTLAPLKTGKFTLGPFTAECDGMAFESKTIKVEVLDRPAASQRQLPSGGVSLQAEPGAAEAQLKDRIFVEIEVPKTDVYLNEIISATVRLYVNRLAIKDVEYPIIASAGFIMEKFKDYREYQKVLAGLVYNVLEFKTSIYPITTGTLTLGPAQIRCNLIVQRQARQRQRGAFDDFFDDDFFGDFFGRYQSYPLNLASTQIDIQVRPFPQEGRPSDFQGAIGDFDLVGFEVNPKQVNVGDPITLTMKVSGRGNFATVNAPSVKVNTDDFKSYEPQARLQENEKSFEQVLMPLNDTVRHIPVATFSFFNPAKGAYQTIERGPVAITVTRPQQPQEQMLPEIIEGPGQFAMPEREEVLGKDIIYIKDDIGDIRKKKEGVYKNRALQLFLPVPLLILFVMFLAKRQRERIEKDTRYARALRAPRAAKKGLRQSSRLLAEGKLVEFSEAIFKTLQEYIGDRLHIPAGGITMRVVDEQLYPRGLDTEMLKKLSQIFEACDMARFGSYGLTGQKAQEILQSAREIINYLESVKL